MRNLAFASIAVLAIAAPLSAQVVTEVGGMTVPNSFIDMDALPLGATSLAALNAAGTNGGATLAGMTLSAKAAAAGIYNTQVCGYALAAGSGTGGTVPHIIDNSGGAAFDAFTISLDLGAASTEFGLLVGDWVGPAVLNFYSGGSLIYTHTSSTFGLCGTQYYQMTGGSFDRVDIDVSTSAGNWCIMEMYVEQTGPPGPTLSVANLVAGGVVTISASNCTPGGVVRHGYSLFGGGPTTTPWGDLLLSPPFTELPAMTANASGDASLSAPVPAGTTGIQVWMHAIDLGSLTFTNGLAEIIG